MKYIKNFPDHYYQQIYTFTPDYALTVHKDIIAICKKQHDLHYMSYAPYANLLDILYITPEGEYVYSPVVFPYILGYTPIGICIAGGEFFKNYEPARWMSLKYMNYNNPNAGSLNAQNICFGNNYDDILEINNITKISQNVNSSYGYIRTSWQTNTTNLVPSLVTARNKFNISELGTINAYAATDINGKDNTSNILKYATKQPNWRTDNTIINESDIGYTTAACCCARYFTKGTSPGDWYLGGCAEMAMIIQLRNELNEKLYEINKVYEEHSISSLNLGYYWTSTEYNDNNMYLINLNTGSIITSEKSNSYNTLAILQY